MKISEYDKNIQQTISKLSDPLSYKMVCHQHKLGEPLPSIKKLQKHHKTRSRNSFSGVFWKYVVKRKYNTVLYGRLCR